MVVIARGLARRSRAAPGPGAAWRRAAASAHGRPGSIVGACAGLPVAVSVFSCPVIDPYPAREAGSTVAVPNRLRRGGLRRHFGGLRRHAAIRGSVARGEVCDAADRLDIAEGERATLTFVSAVSRRKPVCR